MKATKSVVVFAALCATLFSSCRKSDYVTPDGPNMTTQAAKATDGSNTATLRFKAGTMSTTTLTVQASDGRNLADLGGLRQWNLLYPLSSGGLNLPYGGYENLTTNIKLAPAQAGSASLHLTGDMTMIKGGDEAMGRTIDFTINDPLLLTAKSGPVKLSEGTNMLELLNLHLDKLGDNIPDETWERAMEGSPNTLYISAQNNPELYKLILTNLQSVLHTGGNTQPDGGNANNTGFQSAIRPINRQDVLMKPNP